MTQYAAATIGHFDGVHLGHQHVLRRLRLLAEERGLSRTMAISFDRHPRTIFDETFRPQMLTTIEERRNLLLNTGTQPHFLTFDKAMAALTARDFMEKVLRDELHVKLLLIGFDNRFGRRNAEEDFDSYVEYGRELGIEVVECDSLLLDNGEKISSSGIRDLLLNGQTETANQLLGRPYSICGTVVEGYQEGRKIGFPTANLQADALKLVPSCGVYATTVRIEGCDTAFMGMTNIGHRPTFGEHHRTIETHILDFSGDIYGSRIELLFGKRIRGEQRFDSPDALKQQLERDRLMVKG